MITRMQEIIQVIRFPIRVRRHNRREVEYLIRKYVSTNNNVYDIGCGSAPFQTTVTQQGGEYIGVDIDGGFYGRKPDLIGSAYDVPAPTSSADIVILSQVLEHLTDPSKAIREASRILREGGILIISTPFLYPLHAKPWDYIRITRFFLEKTTTEHQLKLCDDRSLEGFWLTIASITSNYLQGVNRGVVRLTKIIAIIDLCQQWICTLLNSIEAKILKLNRSDAQSIRRDWPVNYCFAYRKATNDNR